jgi:transmembrane sensor
MGEGMNDDLLIKYLLREAEPEEEALVREWISASPENALEFSRLEMIWDSSKKLEQSSSADPEAAWANFKSRVSQPKKEEAKVRKLSQRFSWLQAAAVLFIVAGAWSIYSAFNSGYATIEAGQLVRTELLPDGSEVTLNRNTLLSYRKNFSGETRNVKLDNGEAFFHVSPDKSKPFVIEADDVTVTVLGTSFNVKHLGELTEVIVETGIVRVEMDRQLVELRAGEKVVIRDKDAVLRKEANTDQLYNYYRSKVFIADNTPLWRVVEILNEAYDSKIIIENNQIRDMPLSATFKDESLDTVLNVIAQTFKISVIKQEDKFILR